MGYKAFHSSRGILSKDFCQNNHDNNNCAIILLQDFRQIRDRESCGTKLSVEFKLLLDWVAVRVYQNVQL